MEYYAIIFLLLAVVLYFFYYKSKGSNSGVSALRRYARDLTEMAKNGKLDPVIGRKKEIIRVIQVLSRRNKNNPVLVGEAGVGKTAIVEGLADAIIKKQVPPVLNNKRVLALDLSSILAGTKYRGEFEKRIKKITDEIVAAKRNIILFIDEIHILAESGEAEGAINAADILKPMLARGELQVVGATTPEEYDETIKKDKTLDRRLQPVVVAEATPAQTKEILAGIKNVYEKYHQVVVADSAVAAAVTETKFLKGRSYPDKAIDALDEACSRAHIGAGKKNQPKVTDKDIKEIVRQWQDGV